MYSLIEKPQVNEGQLVELRHAHLSPFDQEIAPQKTLL